MSAHDRARTIAVAIAENAKPTDLIRPGRLQTLRAVDGGVLARPGHTEAAVDLARMAGLKPAGVICEIMSADGSMARMPELERFAAQHDTPIVRIADVVARRQNERVISRRALTRMPTRKAGDFEFMVYSDNLESTLFVALVKGKVAGDAPVLARLHSQCLTGDVFGAYGIGERVSGTPRVMAPVTPSIVVCIGLNYKDHAAEMNKKLPAEPLVFLKGPGSLLGHRGATRRPRDAAFMPSFTGSGSSAAP